MGDPERERRNGTDSLVSGSTGREAGDPDAPSPVGDRALLLAIAVGVALVIGGVVLASAVTTDGGDVAVSETTIETESGLELEASVYEPADASAAEPAPGVALVHGYSVDRTTMENLAIELARRGYVVVNVDQPGHGASDPPPFADGWGGPAALEAIGDRETVDEDRVAIAGYSMGGAAALAAAEDRPDAYDGLVLLASSPSLTEDAAGEPTGLDSDAGVTANGTTPRNVAVVFGTYDELSPSMWGTQPGDVHRSERLAALFGTEPPVEPGETYGDLEAGTARTYVAPAQTHLGLSLSPTAVAATVEWIDRVTAAEGTDAADGRADDGADTAADDAGADGDPPADDQRWQWAALGHLVAFVGALAATVGVTALTWRRLGGARGDSAGRDEDGDTVASTTPRRTGASPIPWRTAGLIAAIPALAFYPLYGLGTLAVPTTRIAPQSLTHGALLWALGSVAVVAAVLRWRRPEAIVDRESVRGLDGQRSALRRAILAAGAGIATLALLSIGAAAVPGGGLRAGLVALDPLPAHRAFSFAVYLLPVALATLALAAALHRAVGPAATVGRDVGRALAVACGGLVAVLGVQYLALFAGAGVLEGVGLLMMAGVRTTVVVAIAAIVSTLVHRLTGSIWPAGALAGAVATWLLVAGGTVDVAPF